MSGFICVICNEKQISDHVFREDNLIRLCLDCAERASIAYRKSYSGFGMKSKARISKELRHSVYSRDGYICLHCGSDKNLTCDHIYPESKGGLTNMDNLQTLCRSCNSRKGVKHV